MTHFSYRSGTWQVVVEDGGVVAVPGDVAIDRVVRLTRMLQQGTPALTDVIDVLAAGSIASLGSFAIALTPGGSVRFAVRGSVSVSIEAETGTESVSGADVSTWSERFVVDPKGFALTLEEARGHTALPIRSGVVLAASITTGQDAPAESVVATADATGTTSAPASDVVALPPAPVAADGGHAQHTLIPAEYTFGSETEALLGADAADEPAADEPATEDAPVAPVPAVDAAPVPEPLSDSALEQTIHKAPTPPTLPAHVVDSTPPAPGVASPPPASPVAPPPAPPAPAASAPFPTIAPPLPPAPPAPVVLGDHDGATISLAEVRRLRAEGSAAPADPEAPTEMIPTVDEPAAAHGTARLSTGQVVELDRTVIIGRRPRTTRASGESMPHLVAVDSPQQDISRSHLEIRPEGDSVVVIDLRTTNGSTLIRPGTDPVRLHPGEPTLVLGGDVVDLGDGVTVAFEGLA
ncbi:FHA domain-containing protein [Microbacterium esteraromaticum]|uniref:FHA domain-containing protein n=1 Tax=Microbacterium esteraromaticum TaxID=57043 RepID=A0A939DU62_9MICO|nr:FHA domain-containing protein [Microbacterium esteraromaticum]MBN8205064.1 FHA domain-containing protein [Microbacterium esteraromaticum]MBN8415218.1 FHA domain-containing protein [Microbacterium esteraromaticum]